MRFLVTISDLYVNTYAVEAANEDEAYEMAHNASEGSKVKLGYCDTDIYVEPYNDRYGRYCDTLPQ